MPNDYKQYCMCRGNGAQPIVKTPYLPPFLTDIDAVALPTTLVKIPGTPGSLRLPEVCLWFVAMATDVWLLINSLTPVAMVIGIRNTADSPDAAGEHWQYIGRPHQRIPRTTLIPKAQSQAAAHARDSIGQQRGQPG